MMEHKTKTNSKTVKENLSGRLEQKNLIFHTRLSLIAVILVLIILYLACAVNPVTQKRELMLLSRSDELALGQQTDEEIIQTYGLYEDKNLSDYIFSVGKKVAAVSHQSDLPYSFKVLDSPVVNAFAVPGGFIYLTRGILAYLNDEAELAGVIGHEVGHVTARHSAQLYSRVIMAQLGLGLAGALSKNFERYAQLAEASLGLLFLSFSRDNERQADDLGVLYSSRAGYDSRQMANLFITLERLKPESGRDGLPSWLSTHPDPPDRIAAIKKAASSWQQANPGVAVKINRDEYLTNLDGLVFGEDPRQGFVEGKVFYHPGLRIQFPVPSGWKLNNTASRVQMISPRENAVLVFSLAREKKADEAAQNFVATNKVKVLGSEVKNLNGFTALRLEFELQAQETKILGLVDFISHPEFVLVFMAYSDSVNYLPYLSTFTASMNGLRLLTDPKKLNLKPERLRIIRVARRNTLAAILQGLGLPENRLKEVAILNGLELTESVEPGTMLKIPVRD